MRANNLVILLGHLGLDPEMKQLASGARKVRLRLATTERWRSRDGEQKERTDWHTVEVWEKTADFCMRYLKKGDQVQVLGTIRNDIVKQEGGKGRLFTTVKAWDVNLLSEWGGREARESSTAVSSVTENAAVVDVMPF